MKFQSLVPGDVFAIRNWRDPFLRTITQPDNGLELGPNQGINAVNLRTGQFEQFQLNQEVFKLDEDKWEHSLASTVAKGINFADILRR